MSDEGKGNKELVGLGHHLRSETEKIENGLVGDGHGFFQDGESRINKMGEDLKEGNEMVSWSGVASGQIHSQQPPQGASVCWERFLHVGSLRVLLVENDDSTRHIVAALLRNCSYEVVEVSNGVQAWKVLEDITNRIDLVLTEVVMPCVSGVALLCKIMSHKTRKNVPVIMMSSHDSMGLVFKCLSKGAVDFLVKPIRKNELKNLWQHVWRRCHSSSGSGSESGTQTQKSVKSKSAKKLDNDSGSNDEEEIGSPVLNFGDGSDHGSGTQSSWTKQVMEDQVDSPRQVSPMDEIPECPDSTCAQVIHANLKPSGDKMVSVTAVKDCQEGRELPEKTLEKNVPKISDRQPACAVEVPVELTSMNHSNAPKIESSRCSEQIDQCMGDSNGENPPGQFNCRDPERIGVVNSVDPRTDSENKNCDAASKYSKMPEINDKAVNDNKEPVSVEQGIKRLRGVQDIGKAMQEDRNVLRRSESSAFSRYNATLHNKISHNDARSPSPLENGLDGKNGVLLNIQSHSGSNAPNQCSNGVSIYVDMTSTSNNEPSQKVVFKSKAAETKESHPSAFQPVKTDHLCAPEQTLLDNINGLQTVKVIVHPVSSNQGLQIQKMGHQFDQNQKPGHNMQLETPSSNLKNLHKKMAAPIPFCGSSNVLDGHVEGNAANYSVNGSASGSNYGSNGQNGSSSAANAGLTNMESDNGVGGKSWCGDASGSGSGGGSGNNIDQNKSAQREAALTKFRQKRKERCFKRKVRYYSRKRLAEQRPRVRGQFVRQTAPESLSKEGTDDGRF